MSKRKHSRAGFLLEIEFTKCKSIPVANTSKSRPRYPLYKLGWEIPAGPICIEFNNGVINSYNRVRPKWSKEWEQAGLLEYHELTFFIVIDYDNPTYTVEITSNKTQQELDLAKNEEFIRRAKEFFKQENDPIWYHADVF